MIDVDELPEVLRKLAAQLEASAHEAANDTADDVLCCWQAEVSGGQMRVIGVRRFPEGSTDTEIVALPLDRSVADYMTLTHPGVGLVLAGMLRRGAKSIETQLAKDRRAVLHSSLAGDFSDLAEQMLVDRHD